MNARDSTRWDLEHALAEPGCAICCLTRAGVLHLAGFGAQGDAWIRAIERLAGAEHPC